MEIITYSKDIPVPKKIFFDRENSSGKDISEIENLEDLKSKIDNFSGLKVDAESIYAGRLDANNTEEKAFSISNRCEIGTISLDDPIQIIASAMHPPGHGINKILMGNKLCVLLVLAMRGRFVGQIAGTT